MRPELASSSLRGVTNLAVVAPVKAGFVVGFETITYVERLRRLLSALNNGRISIRESLMTNPAFPDAIGRFDMLHNFRYAIIPPRGDASRDPDEVLMDPGISYLSLNVTFDGGWEPYMRVIYRDIGSLLDALFCNCSGYPGSKSSNFDDYCRWVRANELDGGLFFTDSAISVGDQKYLDRVERIQRGARDPVEADKAIAGLALESALVQERQALDRALQNPLPVANQALRTLRSLRRLSPYYPPNGEREDAILLRFAQDVLRGFKGLVAKNLFDPGQPLEPLGRLFKEDLDWLKGTPPPSAPVARPELQFDPGNLQPGIVKSDPAITHGCVVLLRVDQPTDAAKYFADWPVGGEAAAGASPIQRNIAFTYGGLRKLGLSKERLDPLPQEFIEGMEARAGLLGDVRANHPDNWNRPRPNWPPGSGAAAGQPIDLSTVHVVLTLRLTDTSNLADGLHPDFETEVKNLATGQGLTVLSFQPIRSYPGGARPGRGHFDFADGISQPNHSVAPDPAKPDEVKMGELLMGYSNGRGDGPFPTRADSLFDDGCFLVMRKLRQHVDVLHDVLDREALALVVDQRQAPAMKEYLLEKMMGRRKDGTTLLDPPGLNLTNDFDYSGDPQGAKCPFQSHVRRTNPRDGRQYLPRIVRRGMSYGPAITGSAAPDVERGIVFMAFCASIAEQFEVVQRWVTGGNSSGVSSTQADPFLGVPEPGDLRTLRFDREDGDVMRVHLGKRPFVSLEWGLYLFVPSLAALRGLWEGLLKPSKEAPPLSTVGASPLQAASSTPQGHSLDQWRSVLEDPNPERSAAGWKMVRTQGAGGALATPYGLLVGKASAVLEVLRDDGRRFSVCGYGDRMAKSVGSGYLGLDPHSGHSAQAPSVNQAIASIDAKTAFNAARGIVDGALVKLRALALPEVPRKVPVDLVALSEAALARLCSIWFGLPDEKLMVTGGRNGNEPVTPPRCPGHLFSTSRYIFAPRPSTTVENEGAAQGLAVRHAFEKLIGSGTGLVGLAEDIRKSLKVNMDAEADGGVDLLARTLAGVMVGFPPTVHGNFLRVIDSWLKTGDLWDLQRRLAERLVGTPDPYQRANDVLFDPLIAAMRRRPVPEMIWRTAVDAAQLDGKAPIDPERRVVLGLGSAMSEESADPYLMFGGRRDAEPKTTHACPGYGMAVGVLLALLSGLLEAGTLRPTGSSILLTLIPPAS